MIASSGNEINSERGLGQCHCVRHDHDLNSREVSFLGSVLKMPCQSLTAHILQEIHATKRHELAQLVEAQRYRLAGGGFDSPSLSLDFLLN